MMNCVYMLVNLCLYDVIYVFRVCFLDDVIIIELIGIIIVVFLSMLSDMFMLELYFNFRRICG